MTRGKFNVPFTNLFLAQINGDSISIVASKFDLQRVTLTWLDDLKTSDMSKSLLFFINTLTSSVGTKFNIWWSDRITKKTHFTFTHLMGWRTLLEDAEDHIWLALSVRLCFSFLEVYQAAMDLYGLIHARFILSPRGLAMMREKFLLGAFGMC